MKIKDILLMVAVATAALTGCGIVMYPRGIIIHRPFF